MNSIIYGGVINTMDPKNKNAEAVVFNDEEILFVGNLEEAKKNFEAENEINLDGKTLFPGFTDTHCHLSFTGEMLTLPNVFEIDNIKDVLNFFAEEAKKLDKDSALLVNGFGGVLIKEKRLPTLEEMDKAVPDHVLICKTAGTHETLVNSQALKLIEKVAKEENIPVAKEDMQTGILRNEANLLAFSLSSRLMNEDQRKNSMQKVIDECVKNGIVAAHTLEGKDLKNDSDVYSFLKLKDELPFDARIYYQTTNVEEVLGLGLKQIGGCFKCLLDGDVDPGTAAMRKPYTNNPKNSGTLYFTQEKLNEFFKKANRAGLQICMHAIGDAAIEQALNAYEYALNDYPRNDHRHRIEHFEIGDYDLIERAKNMGILLAMQPVFDYYWPYETYVPYLGEERAKKRCMLRDALDSGIKVGGGSDSPVTPMNPFLSIHEAVNHSVESSRITLDEALKMHTSDAAYLGFQENIRGSIEKGKRPDFAIVSENPYEVSKENLDKIKVLATIFGGKVVWSSESLNGKLK